MICKPKNEYKQVAYLNQKCKYKKYLRTRFQAWEPNPEEYSHEEAPTGRDSSRISTPLLYLSLISILIASLDLVDLYLMFWLFIFWSGLLQGGLAFYFIAWWGECVSLDQTDLTSDRDGSSKAVEEAFGRRAPTLTLGGRAAPGWGWLAPPGGVCWSPYSESLLESSWSLWCPPSVTDKFHG